MLHHYYYPYRLRRFEGDSYYRLTLTDIWPKECADACLAQTGFYCRSFDYDRTLRTCMLSDTTADTVGLIPTADGYPYDHFELGKSVYFFSLNPYLSFCLIFISLKKKQS